MFTEKAKRVVLHGTSREEKNTIFQVNAQFFKPSGRYLLDPYRGRSPLSTAAVVAKLRTHTKKKPAASQSNKTNISMTFPYQTIKPVLSLLPIILLLYTNTTIE